MEMGRDAKHAVEDAHVDFVRSEVEHLLKLQGGRFREARVQANLTIEEVAARSQLHSNTVGRIERGQAEASAEQLLRIARAIGVAPITLSLFGGSSTVSTDDEDFVLLDMLDAQVSGGHGAVNGQHDVIGKFAFRTSWLKAKGLNKSNAHIVRVRGRSMADRINDGDILLVNTSINTLTQDGVYVIELDGEDYVKLLQRDFTTGGVRIVSYNPAFPVQVLEGDAANRLRIVGSVVWHGGDL